MSIPGATIGKSAWSFQRAPAAASSLSTSSAPVVPHNSANLLPNTTKISPQDVPHTAPAAECLPKSCVAPCMRGLFSFEFFNKMQSRCFPALYDGTDNVVIGAPTAAGKTICFELALAAFFARLARSPTQKATTAAWSSMNSTQEKHTSNATATAVDFGNNFKKAIYLAPLKSLVQERLKDWSSKLRPLGIKCQELSGDNGDDLEKECDLYLSTPEKWDAITRRWKDYSDTLEKIGLIMVDEVHLLGEDRGPVLEAVVARCLSMAKEGHLPRIVALSASSPNVCDIGKWINAPTENVFLFGDEHRPITPKLHVVGYPPSKNDFLFERTLDFKLWSVIAQFSDRKPSLVFCSSRKSTISAALKLLEMCSQNSSSYVVNAGQRERLFEAAKLVQNEPQLAACILSGIAYHHAGMSIDNRSLVEKLFSSGEDVMVVMATSTLAVGVNLPAYLVVIKNTSFWTQSNGVEECSPIQIRQMIGRAGRPQFGDSSAVAVIMTQQTKVSSYEHILQMTYAPTESKLHLQLTDTLLTEIVVGTISSFKTALLFLQRTFLAVRIHENPRQYMVDLSTQAVNATATQNFPATNNPGVLHPLLRSMCMSALAALRKYECIAVENRSLLIGTDLGRCLSRWFVSFKSVQAIFDYFPPRTLSTAQEESEERPDHDVSTRQILECIAASPQFSDLIVRRGEKKELKEFSTKSRFPLAKGIFKTEKVMILLQSGFVGTFADTSLRSEAISCTTTAISLSSCLAQFFLDRGWFFALHKTLLLLKSFRKLCWTQGGPQTSQIPIITREMASQLERAGYKTLMDLTTATQEAIQQVLNQRPAFVQNIFNRLQQVPAYSLMVHVSNSGGARVLKFEAHAISTPKNTDRFEHRWAVLGQHGKVIAHRILPIGGVNAEHFSFTLSVDVNITGEVEFFFASDEWIGFDIVGSVSLESSGYQHLTIQSEYQDPYDDNAGRPASKRKRILKTSAKPTSATETFCQHKCKNKFTCKHDCCKSHPEVAASGKVRIDPLDSHHSVTVRGDSNVLNQAKQTQNYADTDPELGDYEPPRKKNFSPFVRTSFASNPARTAFQNTQDHFGASSLSSRTAPNRPSRAGEQVAQFATPTTSLPVLSVAPAIVTTRPGAKGINFLSQAPVKLNTPAQRSDGSSSGTSASSLSSTTGLSVVPGTNHRPNAIRAKIPTLKAGSKPASEVMNARPIPLSTSPSLPANSLQHIAPLTVERSPRIQLPQILPLRTADKPNFASGAAPSRPFGAQRENVPAFKSTTAPSTNPPLVHPIPKRPVQAQLKPVAQGASSWSSLLNWDLDVNSFQQEEL